MAVTALKRDVVKARSWKPDPLLAALIAKLPAGGSSWPAEDRSAWLKMMAMAFNVVYAGEAVEMPKFLAETGGQAGMSDALAAATERAQRALEPFVRMAPHAFYIDKEGVARGQGGKQILASDVIGVIYDLRGDKGDLGTIMWADGKMGVSGVQLEIAAA